jgi:hypothetical protein
VNDGNQTEVAYLIRIRACHCHPGIIFIFAILLFVFGPEKLPKIARELGKVVQEFNRASSSIMKGSDKASSGLTKGVRPSSTGGSRSHPDIRILRFFSVVMMTLLLSGFIFTFPVYVVLLVKVGIITTEQIKKSRKHIYVGAVVLIALIDPEPSLVTEVTCIIPIIVLMEASILIARRFEKQREQAEKE